MNPADEALRFEVRGIVQGIGFRPAIDRRAREIGVRGWVQNDGQGVTIHVEGRPAAVAAFHAALGTAPPPGSRISALHVKRVAAEGHAGFAIRPSDLSSAPRAEITPDLPVCDDCLAELRDPANRRFRYPYINCTACGPRYSLVLGLPYDRVRTTMAGWPLCGACQAEYDDPANRRYHAEPVACPRCGPGYHLEIDGTIVARSHSAVERVVALLREGRIVAIKGIGGYHLACAAGDSQAVARLRARKFRKEQPFALMVGDRAAAESLLLRDDPALAWLDHPARPIVLAPARVELPGVADASDQLGVMLPYAPLHHLLFDAGAPGPLVLTSANRSSEPIAYRDHDARERLAGLADAFLVGERPIARRVDDSVLTVRPSGRPLVVRRSRGLAPGVLAVLPAGRPILAVGADLKNTVALVVDGRVIGSQHVGDLGDIETDRAWERTIADLLAMYRIDPAELLVVHDAHPGYVTTRGAQRLACGKRLAVQHHRAHVASVLAERGELDRRVVGLALDGTGHGDDGTTWGFELFVGSVRGGFERVAHPRPAVLPGGDAAARHPVQAAAGFLATIDTPDLHAPPFEFPGRYDQALQLVRRQVRCFPTTSAGRLFDTAAALCGFTREITYEGQAAIWLEAQARQAGTSDAYPFPDLDFRPLLAGVIADRLAGRPVPEIARAFHAGLAAGLAAAASRLARAAGLRDVACSGGVFQNRLLCRLLEECLETGLTVLHNEVVPPGDGGIALGQAALGAVAGVDPGLGS